MNNFKLPLKKHMLRLCMWDKEQKLCWIIIIMIPKEWKVCNIFIISYFFFLKLKTFSSQFFFFLFTKFSILYVYFSDIADGVTGRWQQLVTRAEERHKLVTASLNFYKTAEQVNLFILFFEVFLVSLNLVSLFQVFKNCTLKL